MNKHKRRRKNNKKMRKIERKNNSWLENLELKFTKAIKKQ